MALAEARVTRVLETLDDLARRGVDSCQPAHIEALRQGTFATAAIKELSIVNPEGRTLCNDIGNQLDQRRVVSSEPVMAGNPILMEVVRLGPGVGVPWIRFRKPGEGGASSLAALVPVLLFVPQVSSGGEPMNFHARMLTTGGTLIAESGSMQMGSDVNDLVMADLPSNRFALRTHITAPPDNVAPGQSDLRAIGSIVSGLLAIFILALSVLLPRRERGNPIAEIERALGAGEFVPYFQPIVDIRSGRLRGAEVLVRWRKPDGTIVPPAAFIPLAESSGLIIEMTRSLMRRGFQGGGAGVGERPPMTIRLQFTTPPFF